MAKTKTKKSTTPSGLGISRSRHSFSCTWKPSYSEKVVFQRRLNKSSKQMGSKQSLSPVTSTSKTISTGTGVSPEINLNNYCPFKNSYITYIGFRVQGKNKNNTKKKKKKTVTTQINSMYNWSGWKDMALSPPKPPKITCERTSAYSSTFTMELDQHITNRQYWGTHIEYRSALRLDTNDASAAKIPESDWSAITREVIYNSVTQTDKTTFTYTINDSSNSGIIEDAKSSARWLAARVVGPPGRSSGSPLPGTR